MFVPIPVRITVDTAGSVKHVHVIHANAEQDRSIEEALRQWTFKSYQIEWTHGSDRDRPGIPLYPEEVTGARAYGAI
jgi:hypothetical protein